MKVSRLAGTVAGLLAFALAPAVAHADRTYTIRIEGVNGTLVPKTTVTVPDSGAIPGAAPECTWDTPAGAVEKATNGNWDRARFVQTIMGETHSDFPQGWFIWTNRQFGSGFCEASAPSGTDIVVNASTYDDNFNAVDIPLYLDNPPVNGVKGAPVTISVVQPNPDTGQYSCCDFISNTGTPKAAAGATVTLGSVSGTTGADGKVTLTPAESGSLTLKAQRGSTTARSETATVCIAASAADGTCGTIKPTDPGIVAPAGPDKTPAISRLTSVTEGKRYTKATAPRELKGSAADPSGILMVKLRLTRNDKGKCSYFSGRKLEFRKMKCGASHGSWFKIGTVGEWSYLLPEKLPAGRYVLDVNAIDRAYNRDDKLRRGGNRVVFTVA